MESVLVEKRLGDEGCLFTALVKLLLLLRLMPVRWLVASFLDSTRQWLPAGHRALNSGIVGVHCLHLTSTQLAMEVVSSEEWRCAF